MLLEIHLGEAYRKAVFLFALSHLIADSLIREVTVGSRKEILRLLLCLNGIRGPLSSQVPTSSLIRGEKKCKWSLQGCEHLPERMHQSVQLPNVVPQATAVMRISDFSTSCF